MILSYNLLVSFYPLQTGFIEERFGDALNIKTKKPLKNNLEFCFELGWGWGLHFILSLLLSGLIPDIKCLIF